MQRQGQRKVGQAAASANLMMYKGKLLSIAVHACIVGYNGGGTWRGRGGRPGWRRCQAGRRHMAILRRG